MTQSSANLDPIGLGIVGLGMAGAVMVHAAATHSGYVLKAAADPHAGPREAFTRDHNARAYAGAEELMADPEVQAVYIATPHQFHAPHAVLAAEHGKHIILEKPMALTLSECDAIITAVERYKVQHVGGDSQTTGSMASPIKGSRVAVKPSTKIILSDWPWFGDRDINNRRSVWHNDRGRPWFPTLYGDTHVANFKFPANRQALEGQSPDTNFAWW